MSAAPPSVAVHAHVHYPDIWREMSAVLARRLTLPFDLVLTSSHPERDLAVPQAAALNAVRFVPVENRGRDILPFLRGLAAAPGPAFGLKLHTKMSPQRLDGPQWRTALLDSLLPEGGGAADIVRRMAADPRIGVVAPAGFNLSVRPWILVNRPGMERAMAAIGASLAEADMDDAFFAAGSMFWFRRTALAALVHPALPAVFEPEEGQLDGTVAHGMERLFPVEARRQGFVSLAVPALEASRPDTPTPELLALARSHADIPSRYFPAPYIAALPPDASAETLARTLADTPAPTPEAALPRPPPRPWPVRLLLPAYRLLPDRLRLALRSALGR